MRFDLERGHGRRGRRHAGLMMMARGMGAMGGRGGRPGGPFGGWDDDDGEGGRGGPGGRGFGRGRRMFAAGELRLLLLGLLGAGARHGYELIKAIGEMTGGEYAPSPGVVYPTLSLLADEGLIAEAAGEGARKAFALTPAGEAELAGREAEYEGIVERLRGFAEQGGRQRPAPVMRAMANLKMALRGRVIRSGFDEATAHAIADVLDEAARRIERL